MLIKRGKKQKRKPEAPEKPGGKKRPRIRTRLRTDPNTGHPLVTGKLVNYLETVLQQKKLRLQNDEQKPNEEQQQKPKAEQQQRPELARAVDIAVKAFEACVSRVGGGDAGSSRKKSKKSANDDDGSAADGEQQFVVNEEEVFDRVVQLCFRSLGKCLYVLLDPLEKPKKEGNNKFTGKKRKKNGGDAINGKESGKHTHFRHWHRYRLLAKRYLTAVHGFLVELHANEMIVPAIRAVSDLVDLYLHFPKLCKHLIKCLIQIWSRQGHSEEARCMAFAALCKCGRMDVKMFPLIYKGCYTAYVANCKLIDPETLPSVGFMQRSFQELAFLHPGIAYEYSFVYIRQFAIHLRNAMIAKRKDLIQTVYNWQFLKGLQLWTGLVCEGNRRFPTKSERQHFWYRELVHPLVECITIELRLFPSTKFLPLRIHCVRLLLTIQQGCSVFIPTLAYTIELLDELAEIDVKKPQAGKGTARDFELDRLLRLSREQLEDAGVRQLLAQQIHTLAQEALAVLNQSEPGYQLLLTPIAANLRRFLKTCANREHVRLFGQLMRAQMTPEGVGPTKKHGGGEGGEDEEEKEGEPKKKMGKFDEKKVKKMEK